MEIMFAPMACGANLEIAAAARARGREAILREFDLSPQRKYLGYFAHFRPVKRHDLLIQSFIEVMNEFPEWQLVLAGGGQCFDACKALAAPHRDRIHMLGGIQHERAIQLMAMMDAVVHCSTVETFGYSMLEPLLLGVPALLTRVGIAREIEREGKAIVVDPNSGPALKEGLRAIMRADGRLAAM